ncbi:peroxin [Geranomyces variabilis]|uniref:Peroxin n=1 Tax=Geranomyces variabilis TaxID=109894 RepID=A0AAD5TEP2_9FUNG|nr:peroxin [Geranomyces variabilis]
MSAIVSSIQGFLARNRRKFYWLGGTAGSGYVLLKYAQWKWTEYNTKRDLEQTAKSNVKRRFEQNLQDCTFAVGSLLPTLGENLFEELNVELVTAQLQQTRQAVAAAKGEGGSEDQAAASATTPTTTPAAAQPPPAPPASPPTSVDKDPATKADAPKPKKGKIELWQELKILSFTRTISSVYLVTLLIVFTHLQLNLLGRFFYLDSVVAFSQVDHEQEIKGTVGGAKGVSDETERKYLTFSWYVLNVGWRQCVKKVQTAVEDVVGSMSLKELITYNTVIDIITRVREKVENNPDGSAGVSPSTYLLPEEGHEDEVLRAGGCSNDAFVMDASLKELLNETRDFLESADFHKVVTSCFDEAFDLLLKQIRPTFFTDPDYKLPRSAVTEVRDGADDAAAAGVMTSGSSSPEPAPQGKSLPLAGVIPAVSRLVHNVVNGVPNIFLEVLSAQPDLKAFSVVMYTGWEDRAI